MGWLGILTSGIGLLHRLDLLAGSTSIVARRWMVMRPGPRAPGLAEYSFDPEARIAGSSSLRLQSKGRHIVKVMSPPIGEARNHGGVDL